MEQEKFGKPKEMEFKLKTIKFASKLNYKTKKKINHGAKGKLPAGTKLKTKANKYEIKAGNLNNAMQDHFTSGIKGRNLHSNTPNNMLTTNNMLSLQSNMSKDILKHLATK